MDPGRFGIGDTLHLHDGSRAEVVAPTEDGRTVRARYLDSPGDPSLAGTEDLVAAGRTAGFTPAPPGPEWGSRVAVIVYPASMSDDYESGYVAETLTGVPHGVVVSAGGEDTPEQAVDRLIAALDAFGLTGTVAVEDASRGGGTGTYEVEIP